MVEIGAVGLQPGLNLIMVLWLIFIYINRNWSNNFNLGKERKRAAVAEDAQNTHWGRWRDLKWHHKKNMFVSREIRYKKRGYAQIHPSCIEWQPLALSYWVELSLGSGPTCIFYKYFNNIK
jgi:hypothetical protein